MHIETSEYLTVLNATLHTDSGNEVALYGSPVDGYILAVLAKNQGHVHLTEADIDGLRDLVEKMAKHGRSVSQDAGVCEHGRLICRICTHAPVRPRPCRIQAGDDCIPD